MRICDWLACARRDPTGVLELESASNESARLGVRELTLRNLGSAPDGTLDWILSQKSAMFSSFFVPIRGNNKENIHSISVFFFFITYFQLGKNDCLVLLDSLFVSQ